MNHTRLLWLTQRKSDRFICKDFSSIQIIIAYYILMTVVSYLLFCPPIFRRPDSRVLFIDLFFLTISTISVTRFATVDINSVFNNRGTVLLEVLFQAGGLEIMMISTVFFILSRRRITLKQRQLIMTDMNQPRLGGIVQPIHTVFLILIQFQVIFDSLFSLYFHISGYYTNWRDAIFYGFYQAISAVINSGFDISGNSVIPFTHDHLFLLTIMFLIFIGKIGFSVLLEIHEWLHFKRKNLRKKERGLSFHFSLFSKIALLAFIALFIGGTILTYLLEKDHLFLTINESGRWVSSMFYSMTTQNAGLQINDLGDFQITTLIILSVLMFIGCSSSSVGGGVRTTTAAIIGLHLLAFLKSEDGISALSRKIDDDGVKKSIVVFMSSLIMCFFAVALLSATENPPLILIVVEAAPALGTTGLSLGTTDDLTTIGKLMTVLLMFIGRIGMPYTLMIFVSKETRDSGHEYPSEKITIG